MATTESRRDEQSAVLKEFVSCAQAAERAAYRRPDPWGDDEVGWMTQTGPVTTALWTASANVTLLCDEALREPVTTYGHALNAAVWRDIGDVEVNDHLEEGKTAFMNEARRVSRALDARKRIERGAGCLYCDRMTTEAITPNSGPGTGGAR
ncbi:hypothetical protein LUR56_11520 [Streptomyces sp. MT29]|nr:hypothetical protein [Streptomyces sp. MT29]